MFNIEWKDGTESHDFDYNSKENGDYDIEHFDEDIDENEFDFKVQSVVSFIFFNVLTNRMGTKRNRNGTKLKFSLNTE
jgi:hypothetical protein